MLANNVTGSYKIGSAVALEVGGTWELLLRRRYSRESRRLRMLKGRVFLVIMDCVAVGIVVVYTAFLFLENRARDAGKRDHRLLAPDAYEPGDKHPHFRFRY